MKLLPMLFDKGERNFTGQGLGRLSDALTCVVTETRNSDTEYEVVMTYPIGGVLYDKIQIDMVIGCLAHKHDTEIEAFRIYNIEDDMASGVATIYGRQVGMMLAAQTPITKFHVDGNASAAMTYLKQHVAWYNNFNWLTLSSDITDTCTIDYSVPMKLTEFLISEPEYGVLANYGGEYKWHFYNVQLLKNRGADNGAIVRYGKNMASLKRIRDASDMVTSILPYAAKEYDDGTVLVQSGNDPTSGMIFHVDDYESYYPHISIIDCTGDIIAPEGASGDWMPTADYINEYAAAYLDLNVTGEIPVTYEATVVDDPESVDVEIHMCDTVLLQHPNMGISTKAKIMQTVYNVLSDQWESLKIGTVRSNLSGTLYDLYDRRPTITKIQTGGGTSGTEGYWTWSIEGNIARLTYNRNMTVAITQRYGSYYVSNEMEIQVPSYFSSGWTANQSSLMYAFTPTSGALYVQPYIFDYQGGTISLYLVSLTSTTATGNLTGTVIMTRNTTT